ncbi:killer cell lectin-like receptor subfamily F member 2 [Phyllostomus hastatus]|uniref:killer cell lectin-like receptor subfamily F member 2 n=1 Tax=Phyllostomus hastatus TaxID=9423 RepID=UPI001E6820A8|nr:killer cell lectin-like receptor subfamily F member 2 [Phyllostomus hastatus]
MKAEDGYMVLMGKTQVKSQQRSKDFALYRYYYCIFLVVGCIGILIFVMTVIGLNFSNKKMDFSKNVNTNSLAGDNYMCPNAWLLNQGKCYKFLMTSKTWNESQRDCTKLQAHLPVIHTLKELEFMQKSLKPGHPSWTGLYIMPPENQWMWINEHPFVEQKDFSIIGLTDSMNCAVTTGNQVSSEDCDSKFYGICQRNIV